MAIKLYYKTFLVLLLLFQFDLCANSQIPKLIFPVGHNSFINSVCFNSDNTLIVTGSADMTAKLWLTSNGKELITFKAHTGQVNSACFSPDDTKVLTSSSDGSAKLWDRRSGKLLLSFLGHRREVYCAAFSNDQKYIITCSADRTIKLWNPATGDLIKSYFDENAKIVEVKFSDDNRRFLTRTSTSVIKYWDLNSDSTIFSIRDTSINSKYFFEGNMVYSLDRQGRVNQFIKETKFKSESYYSPMLEGIGKKLSKNKLPIIKKDYFKSSDFLQDGKYVLHKINEIQLNVLESASGRLIPGLLGDLDWMNSFDFNLREGIILLPNSPQSARLISVYGSDIKVLNAGFNWLKTSKFSEDGKMVATASYDGTVIIYNTLNGTVISKLKGNVSTTSYTSASISPNGDNVLLTNVEGEAKIISLLNGATIAHFDGHRRELTSGSFSRTGDLVVTSGGDSTTKVWNSESGVMLFDFHQNNAVYQSRFSNNGKYIATASLDSSVTIWSLETGKQLHKLTGHNGFVFACSFSPDDKYIASSSIDSTIIIWDVELGKIKKILKGHNASVNSVSFNSNGKLLVSGSSDSTVKVWDFDSGKLSKTLENRSDWVEVVRFSPDDSTIIAGSDDGLIKFWDLNSGVLNKVLTEHSGWIWDIEFSKDHKSMITTSSDGKVIFRPNIDSIETFLSFIQMKDDNWVVFDNDYRYDGTEEAINALYFLCDNEVVNLKQIQSELYVPHLLEIIKSGLDVKQLNFKGISDLNICSGTPIMTNLNISENEPYFLSFNVLKRGVGFEYAEIFINNLFQLRIPKDSLTFKDGEYVAKIPLSILSFLSGRNNLISVRAIGRNNIISNTGSVTFFKEGKTPNPNDLKIYAVIIGMSDYVGENNELNVGVQYSNSDAREIAEIIKKITSNILKDPRNQLRLFLFNESVRSPQNGLKPYLKNIQTAMDSISKEATESDVIVFYFAGHGVVVDGIFKMLTAECFDRDCKQGITTDKLIQWLNSNKTKAQKRVFILDACNSGKIFKDLIAIRGDEEILDRSKVQKELQLLGEYSGMIGIAAAQEGQTAKESVVLEHGLLTYCLLSTIKEGLAISDSNKITYQNWFISAKKEMERISRELMIKGQDAQLFMSEQSDFLFGSIRKSDRDSLNIPQLAQKLLLYPHFVDSVSGSDYLSLSSKIVNECLTPLINEGFTISKSGSNGVKIYGSYYFINDSINILCRISSSEKRATLKVIRGRISELDQLLKELIEEVRYTLLKWQ